MRSNFFTFHRCLLHNCATGSLLFACPFARSSVFQLSMPSGTDPANISSQVIFLLKLYLTACPHHNNSGRENNWTLVR